MAKQTINIGASPNDGTGTPLRTSFDYCNLNFTELYTATGPSGNNIVVPGNATITGDLTVDTSTLKVDSTNNRVGIGTATPAVICDVTAIEPDIAIFRSIGASGNDKRLTITSGGDRIILNASNNTNTATAQAYAFQSAGTERYRIAADGVATWSNVGGVASTAMTLNSTGLGIGRSPIAKLNVDKASQTPGGTTPNGAFVITDNAGSNLALEFGVNSANASYIQARNSTSATYYNLFLNPDGGNVAVGTASSGGSISNTSQILAGIFSTLIGTASSVVTATPTTIFAAPSESTLIVTAYVSGAAPSDYKVVAVVKVSGGVVAITNISTATSITITASGTNIQVTQTSGGTQNVGFNVLRLA